MKQRFSELVKQAEQGEFKNTTEIGEVKYYLISKTDHSFNVLVKYTSTTLRTDEVYTEVNFNLRDKEFYIIRNGRAVKFNASNLDKVVPRKKGVAITSIHGDDEFNSKTGTTKFFEFVSVEENEGMYLELVKVIGNLGEEVLEMPSRALVRLITDYHKLELVYKAGIDLNIINSRKIRKQIIKAGVEDKRKLHQILGITKSQTKYLRNNKESASPSMLLSALMNVDHQEFEIFMSDIELIRELEVEKNIEGRERVFADTAGVSEFGPAISVKRGYALHNFYHRNFYGFVFEFDFPNRRKLIEYLLFDSLLSQGMEFREALSNYRDYYRMNIEMEEENFDMYPRYLKTYHDIISRNYKTIEDEIINNNFSKATKGYQYLEGGTDKYSLIIPTSPRDLVTEGNALHHCIPSYVKQVADKRTKIIFLRDIEEEDKPLLTVEVRGNEIVQARGFGNRLPNRKEERALNEYAKDKELGIISFT